MTPENSVRMQTHASARQGLPQVSIILASSDTGAVVETPLHSESI